MPVTALKPADQLDPGGLADLTRLCKALADELRLEILRLLKNESFGVLEICRVLDIRQSALSHHLKILATARLVSTRREGNSIFYRRPLILDSDPFAELKNCAFASIDRLPVPTEKLDRVELIHRERSQQSLDFFRRNAAKFREQQGLIAEYQQYAGTLEDLIDGIGFHHSPPVIMEVGPGEGELLLQLARRFERIIALDNSTEMLDRARMTIEENQVDNVEFIHGDISGPLPPGSAPGRESSRKYTHQTSADTEHGNARALQCDLIILNMVLHHIPAPGNVFREARRLLNANGTLLLVELISHDQDWVRESCGDLWLGFDTHDLDSWATEAGLAVGQSLYLGLRNGFQIQIRLFVNGVPDTVSVTNSER